VLHKNIQEEIGESMIFNEGTIVKLDKELILKYMESTI